jgi:hypothetical protein
VGCDCDCTDWVVGKNGDVDIERRQLKCGFECAIGLMDLRNAVAMVLRWWKELEVGGDRSDRYYFKLYCVNVIPVISYIRMRIVLDRALELQLSSI